MRQGSRGDEGAAQETHINGTCFKWAVVTSYKEQWPACGVPPPPIYVV
jgi:hypothetical protein